MPEFYTIALLALAALAIQITPGPDMMLVMGRGIGQGYLIAQATALGIALAGLIQIPLLAFGISQVVANHTLLFDLIKFAGAGYLIYLGMKQLQSEGVIDQRHSVVQTGYGRAILDGCVANLLNPKLIVFQLAFLPQFVDPAVGPVWSQLLILGIVMKVCGFLIMSMVAMSSATVGAWLENNPVYQLWQTRIVGLILVAIGLRLLFELNIGIDH